MRLRDGGEVTFPSSIVARVDPDEVPYPEIAGPGDAETRDRRRAPAAGRAQRQPALVPGSKCWRRGRYADLISTVAAAHNWMRGWCTR